MVMKAFQVIEKYLFPSWDILLLTQEDCVSGQKRIVHQSMFHIQYQGQYKTKFLRSLALF